jgi:uncharacterized protein YkwD
MNTKYVNRYVLVSLVLWVCLLGGFLYFNPSNIPESVYPMTSNDYAGVMLTQIATYRHENHLPPLTTHDSLCRAAYVRISQIQENFSHTGFPEAMIDVYLSSYLTSTGENLSRDYLLPTQVLPAWLASASHKANLDADYTYHCLVCDKTYCVHLFGK